MNIRRVLGCTICFTVAKETVCVTVMYAHVSHCNIYQAHSSNLSSQIGERAEFLNKSAQKR